MPKKILALMAMLIISLILLEQLMGQQIEPQPKTELSRFSCRLRWQNCERREDSLAAIVTVSKQFVAAKRTGLSQSEFNNAESGG